MQQSSVCVQISHIDYALARPGPLDDTTAFPLVPIVRIFGFSSVGLPACVHVHQVRSQLVIISSIRMLSRFILISMSNIQGF